jgi:hypothetical protein
VRLRLRLAGDGLPPAFGPDFDLVLRQRERDADQFYAT